MKKKYLKIFPPKFELPTEIRYFDVRDFVTRVFVNSGIFYSGSCYIIKDQYTDSSIALHESSRASWRKYFSSRVESSLTFFELFEFFKPRVSYFSSRVESSWIFFEFCSSRVESSRVEFNFLNNAKKISCDFFMSQISGRYFWFRRLYWFCFVWWSSWRFLVAQ